MIRSAAGGGEVSGVGSHIASSAGSRDHVTVPSVLCTVYCRYCTGHCVDTVYCRYSPLWSAAAAKVDLGLISAAVLAAAAAAADCLRPKSGLTKKMLLCWGEERVAAQPEDD